MLLATLLLGLLPTGFELEDATYASQSTPASSCVTRFFECAEKRDANSLFALLSTDAEIEELNTLFELLGQMPFSMELQVAEMDNQERRLTSVLVQSQLDSEGSEFWFWQKQEKGLWKVFTVNGDDRYSREWLYQTPKTGQAKTPLLAANTLFEAMQVGDAVTAERATSDLAWRAEGGDMISLFTTSHTTGLGFVVERPKRVGERATVNFGFEFDGKRQGDATLYVERRGDGWIATGFGDKPEYAQRFLTGEVAGTVWPKSPFDAYESLVHAVKAKQVLRIQALSTPGYWAEDRIARHWTPTKKSRNTLVAAPDSVSVEGPKAAGRIDFVNKAGKVQRSVHCLLESRPGGWRLVGHTEDAAKAEEHVKGVVETPQPK